MIKIADILLAFDEEEFIGRTMRYANREIIVDDGSQDYSTGADSCLGITNFQSGYWDFAAIVKDALGFRKSGSRSELQNYLTLSEKNINIPLKEGD